MSNAPWQIQTSTRIYYAKVADKTATGYTLSNYWELDGKRWRYDKGALVLSNKSGAINITKRTEEQKNGE